MLFSAAVTLIYSTAVITNYDKPTKTFLLQLFDSTNKFILTFIE